MTFLRHNLLFVVIGLCAASLDCSSSESPKTRENLIDNAGFEERSSNGLPTAWSVVPAYEGKGEATIDTAVAGQGRCSLKITPRTSGATDPYGVHTPIDPDRIRGRMLVLTGLVKTSGICSNGVAILVTADKEHWTPLPNDTNGKFVAFRKTFSIAQNVSKAGVLLLAAGSQGAAWFDDLKLVTDERESPPHDAKHTARTATGENLIGNPGFEEVDSTGFPRAWRIVPAYIGKGEAVTDTTTASDGRCSLRLTPKTSGSMDPFGVHTELNADAIKGHAITLSGYVKTEDINDNGVAVLLTTDGEQWAPLPTDTGGRFVPFHKTFRAGRSTSTAGLLLLVAGKSGHAWFDDLRLVIGENDATPKTMTSRAEQNESGSISKINTPGWQDSVYVSPDGSALYFSYLPYKQKDFLDLFYGRTTEEDITSHGPFRPGHHGALTFDTYVAQRNEDGTWGPPVNLNINGPYSLYSAKLSHDGSELYYAIRDDPRNYGADDIYFSRRLPDGQWSPPENLGPTINTKFREDTPCLSADGRTMWFARNEHETLGWEIMVSNRINGRWSTPRKLGPPINQTPPSESANYQPFVTADGKELYFTRIQQLYVSRRGSDGRWQHPTPVFPQLPVSGHASVTDDGRYLYFLTAADSESRSQEHWTIWYAERGRHGDWERPRPVD